jgi:bifunctional non-homologous end joining protein LigD
MKSISLFYRDGTSDKVYRAEIVPDGAEYRVNFQFGRRGTKLAEGTKTRIPVSLALAENIFAKLVAEKRGKGYTEEAGGTPFDGDTVALGEILPHPRKNLISAEEMQARIISDGGNAQRKYDCELGRLDIGGGTVLLGEKMMRRKSGGFYTAADRVAFDKFGEFFAAFTVEVWRGGNALCLPEHERQTMLNSLTLPAGVIQAEPVYNVADCMDSGAEGVVWRAWDAPWSAGMLCCKQLGIWPCRIIKTGGTQSVQIADAATGELRGNLKLGGGKVDRVRVGSIVKVEGLGLTNDGFIREPRPCKDTADSWLVKF